MGSSALSVLLTKITCSDDGELCANLLKLQPLIKVQLNNHCYYKRLPLGQIQCCLTMFYQR